jgi:hypothetical protein
VSVLVAVGEGVAIVAVEVNVAVSDMGVVAAGVSSAAGAQAARISTAARAKMNNREDLGKIS